MRKFPIAMLFSILAATSVFSFDVVDQEQLDTVDGSTTAIGGSSEQEIAQTFTVGVDGHLTQIRIPVGCSSGTLIVEIQRVNADGEPSGRVVSSARVAAEDLMPPPLDYETIYLSPPVPVRRGERYAIVLKNLTGTCGVLRGPTEDTYPGGMYFYDSRPNPPGWVGGKDRPAPSSTQADMPFQTLVDDGSGGGSSNFCFGSLGGALIPLPFTDDLPICRCLSDSVLNSFRCRLLHPDFFIIRRVEFPRNIGRRFRETWFFTPLGKLDGPVRMSFSGQGINQRITHVFGKTAKEGSFETFTILRRLPRGLGNIRGRATFSYPKKNANSRFQRSFGLNATFPLRKKQSSNPIQR